MTEDGCDSPLRRDERIVSRSELAPQVLDLVAHGFTFALAYAFLIFSLVSWLSAESPAVRCCSA